jgi:adenylate kinase family enzyme
MHRINVNGTSGSGKSFLARRLAERLGCPYYELDAFNHRPNWTEAPLEEFRALVAEAAAGERWVIDGNYSKARDLVLARADTVVWLDYPLPVILGRLTRRTLRRCLRREELWHGNREHLATHLFTRNSLFLWVLQTYRRRRRQFQELSADPRNAHIQFIRLGSPRQAEAWLHQFEAPQAGDGGPGPSP